MTPPVERESSLAPDPDKHAALRRLNRSPHPYHHQSAELPHPSERLRFDTACLAPPNRASRLPLSRYSAGSTPVSDSSTEADDENLLRSLPAPRTKPHKGLRDSYDHLSGLSTPIFSSAATESDQALALARALGKPPPPNAVRRRRQLLRRLLELAIVCALGCMVRANDRVRPSVALWRNELYHLSLIYGILLLSYPLRAVLWAYRNRHPSTWLPLKAPATFDPAPILYPSAIAISVSLLTSDSLPHAIPTNIILSISSIPPALIPMARKGVPLDLVHWALSCLPLAWSDSTRAVPHVFPRASVTREHLLLYPLHRTLCAVLHHLTTTSLLKAELQLLTIALINILVLATSPQIRILQALLWVGGVGTIVLCGPVVQWGISLARVPKWRFRVVSRPRKNPSWRDVRSMISAWHAIKLDLLGPAVDGSLSEATSSNEEALGPSSHRPLSRTCTSGPDGRPGSNHPASPNGQPPSPAGEHFRHQNGAARRNTLPVAETAAHKSSHAAFRRRKRATSITPRPFFKLTQTQATVRRWLYALYTYVTLAAVILLGVRLHMQKYALSGEEPVGWGLGYVFGQWSWFRLQVVRANFEGWVCLPPYYDPSEHLSSRAGWIETIRHQQLGEANTRLAIAAYWILVLILGLAIVFRLKGTYEVDTRRKVFHFMMVVMFLPASYVDPAFAALALSLALAIFLLVDLLRASQLPPLSKPIASFLAPYVDGRDFRGPVVISHIFLLIGCAIPLWLALATVPRAGAGYLAGWEVPTRDVSMVSGVVCVGLGDAAASLIGRRYGHRKWLWGGGKSFEGSLAFATAVFLGLAAAAVWLRVGGWVMTGEPRSLTQSACNAGICASLSSLTEAVLTGGNDNVIVPVVLWTCVKSLGI